MSKVSVLITYHLSYPTRRILRLRKASAQDAPLPRLMLPAPISLLLVAVVPTPRDLEIARVLGWYRIPLRRAPKVVAVDYLAFYQPTGAFGARGGQIEFVAPVKGHELTTRAELIRDEPDHPHAREEYYKLTLGPLAQLPAPIPAGDWKRITFFYTTGELLTGAQTINDLVVPGEERKILWQALRERALNAQLYRVDNLPEMPLDPEILMLLGFLNEKGIKEEESAYE
ncbi:MAG TPA: hypothetical protein PK530_00600 [Anaerolineales bacterium]|nr:hypothetical protein [Anaerolineales bacterium]